MKKMFSILFIPILTAVIFSSCGRDKKGSGENVSTLEAEGENKLSLKEAYKGDFLIGAALNYDQVYDREDSAIALVKKQFNSVSPENILKMGPVHPEPGLYNFEPADRYVNFGVENEMFVVGHALVWHAQVPDWIFVDEAGNKVNKDTLLQRMGTHIETVVGRYKGKVQGWDVVNEALEDDGTFRKTNWLDIIGEEFIEKAFEYAKVADPEAELYYNDYNLWKPEKRDGAVKLLQNLRNRGIEIDGIGMQGHYGLDYPELKQIEASILAFSKLGVQVMITEMDIDLLPNPSKRQGADIAQTFEFQEGFDPYTEALPDSMQQQLSDRYASLFGLFHKHKDKISRVTFWGVADHHSWLNDWPMNDRTSYPLVFDRNYIPKPAYEAILNVKSK